jgi:hypothetical protein
VPATNKIGYFKFEVDVADIKKFATTLFELIFAMYYDPIDDECEIFQLATTDFYLNAFEDEAYPSTWGLISIARDFIVD